MASTTSYKISIEGDATSLKNATGQAEDALGGLDNQVKKTTGGAGNDPLDSIGKKIDVGNLMNAADSVAAVGDKVLDLGKRSVEAAANQNAMNSTFKQTFGDLTPFATSEVNKLSKAYDILPNRIKPSYQQFTAMFKGLGLSTQDAAGKATQAMRISANAAAFYDKSLEDSNSALQSFVKGNYEGGESIGLFANDTQMAAFATKNNLIPATEGAKKASEELLIASEKATKKQQDAIKKHGENSIEAREASLKLKDVQDKIAEELGPQAQKWADVDEKTKQAARLEYAENMLQQAGAIDEVGKMAGQASRESGEYENQMGNLAQAMEDAYADIGKEILPMVLEGIQILVPLVKELAAGWNALPAPIKIVVGVLAGLFVVLSQLMPIVAGIAALMTAMEVTTLPALVAAFAPFIAIIAAVAAAITAIILVYKNWGAISDWLMEKWTAFKAWIEPFWTPLVAFFTSIFNQIQGVIMNVWNTIQAWITQNQELIKNTFSTVWNVIKAVVTGIINYFQPFITGVWNIIASAISTILNTIKITFQTTWNNIKTITSTVFNVIKTVIYTVLNAILGVIKAIMQAITGDWSGAWNSIKGVTQTVWNGIQTIISTIANGVKNVIANVMAGIKSNMTNVWNGIKSITTTVWNGIKDAITAPIQRARDTVSNIVQGIKNLFNFRLRFPEIEIPHIPLPHFEISGSFNPLKGEVPGIGINWYAKGGLFNSPSVIGVGEAGKEAVLPLKDKVLGKIGAMISNTMTTDQMGGANATPSIVNVSIEWQGDVDSQERINSLTDAIVDRMTEQNDSGFR